MAQPMAKRDKVLDRILRGVSDANIAFKDVRNLLTSLGFDERIRGDHHILQEVMWSKS
jgi:hypothetical protein